MRRRRIIKISVLSVIFLLSLVVISVITNRNVEDVTSDMAEASLPTVSFTEEGTTVNTLVGYVSEMDITAMRDTITPLNADGTLETTFQDYGNELTEVGYTVYSLDGETKYLEDEAAIENNQVAIRVGNALGEAKEGVLELKLQIGKKTVSYYTRVEKPDDLSLKQCLDFVQDFHNKTFEKSAQSELTTYLEPNSDGDNSTYQRVTINSSADQVMWGSLAPQLASEVQWSIKESNSMYTSVQASYQVTCEGDTQTETYNIEEFFRVRYAREQIFLLDYNRTMNQEFNGSGKVMSESGILLGIVPSDIPYVTNDDGTIVSFVQERELWNYNQEADQLSLLYSFSGTGSTDPRNRNSQHAVRIISVDANGSTTFAVYGYMNRGAHEGMVGVDIFYFDIEKNSVEEKAFIPSDKSFAIAEEELGRLVYYHNESHLLYVLTGGSLYEINVEDQKQNVIAENLKDGQYVVSEDGHLLAFVSASSEGKFTEVTVLNLNTAQKRTVSAPQGESITPLGFVFSDFAYGFAKPEDAGATVGGEGILPMYVMEIQDSKGEVVKTYQQDSIYIEDVLVENGMLTVNRLQKNEGIYTGIAQDYVTNNEEKAESNISLESYTSEKMERQMRLLYAEGISDPSPKVLRPRQVLYEQAATIALDGAAEENKFYVYGMGRLEGVYDKAGYAVAKAEAVSGVVISSEQAYLWEKGNRDLSFETGVGIFGTEEGETTKAACERVMSSYDATKVDLTGCTLDQVLYIINKGLPVIALTGVDQAILLTGYTTSTVTYIDPATGLENQGAMDAVTQMAATGGNTFIGYISNGK
ncbi:MAG: hypothetical protein PHN80_01460 [Hespellia sp.]|nr:hypothetical protein [Hespellia sp.]